jgi:glycosyltransferase involved in cell wall biosynthesis
MERELRSTVVDIGADTRVLIQNNSRNLGQAITRNLALDVARGGAVVAMDDDDELAEDAFVTWLEPLERDPQIGWSAGQFVDATEDGYIQGRTALPVREIEPGEFFRYWDSPSKLFPLAPFCFAFRTDLARKVGGWQGLPQGEDFGIVIAISSLAPGVVADEIVYIYHRHPGQMRFRENFSELEGSVRNIVWDRAVAMFSFGPSGADNNQRSSAQ